MSRGLIRTRDVLAVACLIAVASSCTNAELDSGTQPVAAVSITPDTISLAVGQVWQLTVTLRDAVGSPLTGRTVKWASSQPTTATVGGYGLVKGLAAGTTIISATSEGESDSAMVSVTVSPAPVASVRVEPSSLELNVGQTGQLTAAALDTAGYVLPGRTVAWSSSQPAHATVNGGGMVTGLAAGSATITATSEGQGGVATVTVSAGSGSLTGLDFPGNVNFPSPSPSAILTWNQTRSGTSPFPAYPATYIWRAFPRPNKNAYGSFWTFLFHARYQTSSFNQASTNEYYGMHPYPDPSNGVSKWEISNYGADEYRDPVVFNQWYTQVVVVYESGGQRYHNYYWNWPNTTTAVVSNNGAPMPAASDPAIIIGDAPWNQGFENPNAILRGYQFYDVALTPAQINQEIASPGSVRTPWYLNLNPTPTDVSDKSGNGHNPAWVGPGRPGVWTGP